MIFLWRKIYFPLGVSAQRYPRLCWSAFFKDIKFGWRAECWLKLFGICLHLTARWWRHQQACNRLHRGARIWQFKTWHFFRESRRAAFGTFNLFSNGFSVVIYLLWNITLVGRCGKLYSLWDITLIFENGNTSPRLPARTLEGCLFIGNVGISFEVFVVYTHWISKQEIDVLDRS